MNCVIPHESNVFRSTRYVTWPWATGIFHTGTAFATTCCLPCNYKNESAQCCCIGFDDNMKTTCQIIDYFLWVLMLLFFPFTFAFSIILDVFNIVIGCICCCNICCTPCLKYKCCEVLDRDEYVKRSNAPLDV